MRVNIWKTFLMVIVLAGCSKTLQDERAENLGFENQMLPVQIAGSTSGKAVLVSSDGFHNRVELVDPTTGTRKNLPVGARNKVMCVRIGQGDTVFVVTTKANGPKGGLQVCEFTIQGKPVSRYTLENAELFVDFMVSPNPAFRIASLNMASHLISLYDSAGHCVGTRGPYTGPEGPFRYAYMATVPDRHLVLVGPRSVKTNCEECPNYMTGNIRIYSGPEDSFALLGQVELGFITRDADWVNLLAMGGVGSAAYLFLRMGKYDEETERSRVGYALVKVYPMSSIAPEIVQTTGYDNLEWGDDGRLYAENGEYRPALTCADISLDGKLFLAFGDGHIQVMEIRD